MACRSLRRSLIYSRVFHFEMMDVGLDNPLAGMGAILCIAASLALHPLDIAASPSLVMTTRNVSRLCQVSPGRQNCPSENHCAGVKRWALLGKTIKAEDSCYLVNTSLERQLQTVTSDQTEAAAQVGKPAGGPPAPCFFLSKPPFSSPPLPTFCISSEG